MIGRGGEGGGGAREEEGAPGFRRLVDEAGVDPVSAAGWAVDLLLTTGPYQPPGGRKQRVRMGLGREQEKQREEQGYGKRRASLVLRPAIAAAILIGCGAAASAALGHWPTVVSDAYRRLVSPSPAVTPAVVEVRNRGAASGRIPRDPPLPAPVPVISTATVPGQPSVAPAAPVPAPGRESIASARARRSPAPAAAEDTAPVLQAMRALRLEGNPARARGLLAKYLERHPSGALAEEAQALTIEAAVAHHDADAPALARRYLGRYPAGHFSLLARQTLERAAP
jgi:hypothetical protein